MSDENKKPETKKPEAGKEVKKAFQFKGKKYLVGTKAPKVIAENKDLKGFF